MNEVRERWLEALRSGHYKQGRERLVSRTNGEYRNCCLGVFYEVNGYRPEKSGTDNRKYHYRVDGLIRPLVLDHKSLRSLFPEFEVDDCLYMFQTILAYLNDNEEYSFTEVADFVDHVLSLDLDKVLDILRNPHGDSVHIMIQDLQLMEPEDE